MGLPGGGSTQQCVLLPQHNEAQCFLDDQQNLHPLSRTTTPWYRPRSRLLYCVKQQRFQKKIQRKKKKGATFNSNKYENIGRTFCRVKKSIHSRCCGLSSLAVLHLCCRLARVVTQLIVAINVLLRIFKQRVRFQFRKFQEPLFYCWQEEQRNHDERLRQC